MADSVYKVADLQARGWLLVEDGNHGEYRPRGDEFGHGEWRFIRATDLDGGRVHFDGAERINDTARARIRKGVGAPGDVLFSHKGTVGKVAMVPPDAPPFVCSPQTTFWRSLDVRRINPRFLYYFLGSSEFSEQWEARKDETDMAAYVSLTAQRELLLRLPEIGDQETFAALLGALDDKIAFNRRMNQTLEELASTLFKSWFVDFDPVQARHDGRDVVGVPETALTLFPEHFEDSLLGPIPKGWTTSTIGEEVRVVGGSTPSTNEPAFWNGDVCWVTPRDLSRLANPVVLASERYITRRGLEQISSGLLPRGAVLLSSRAPIGYLAIAEVPVAINQGFIAMVCDGRLPNHWVHRWTVQNMDEVLARAGGTTFEEISKSSFRPIPVVVPEETVVAEFESIAAPLHERVVASVRETDVLQTLRDTLGPALLSGEMTVKQAEKAVRGVL